MEVVDAIVNQPELIDRGINLDTDGHTNTFDYGTDIPTDLPTHQFNRRREVVVQHRVVENHISLRRGDEILSDIGPAQAWGEPFLMSIASDRVVTKLRAMSDRQSLVSV